METALIHIMPYSLRNQKVYGVYMTKGNLNATLSRKKVGAYTTAIQSVVRYKIFVLLQPFHIVLSNRPSAVVWWMETGELPQHRGADVHSMFGTTSSI